MKDRAVRLLTAAREKSDGPDWALKRSAGLLAESWAGHTAPPAVRDKELYRARGDLVAARAEAEQERSSRFLLGTTPLSFVTFEERLRKTDPWVKEVRRHYFREPYFNEVGAPFEEHSDAEDWISHSKDWDSHALGSDSGRGSDDPSVRWAEKREEALDEAYERLRDVADDLWDLTGREVQLEYPHRLEYETANGRTKVLSVGAFNPLAKFADAIEGISRYLGVPQPATVLYVLCGTQPHFPRGRLQVRTPRVRSPVGDLHRREVNITLLGPISRNEMSDVLDAVASAWERQGPPSGRVTVADRVLYQIVRELGGEMRGRQPRGFWQKVKERWDAPPRPDGLPGRGVTANGLAKRWERLKKKLPREEATDATEA